MYNLLSKVYDLGLTVRAQFVFSALNTILSHLVRDAQRSHSTTGLVLGMNRYKR
jgi:hypothetical protein